MKKYNSVCFLGFIEEGSVYHSKGVANDYIKLRSELYDLIMKVVNNGYSNFYCLLENDFDILVGRIVLEVKSTCIDKHVFLNCVVPYKGIKDGYGDYLLLKNKFILQNAQKIIHIQGENEEIYVNKRQFMIKNCSMLIKFFTDKEREKKQIIDFANKKGLKIIDLHQLLDENK